MDAHRGDSDVQGRRARAADWLAHGYPRWAGVVGSALIFALLHPSPTPASFVYPLGFGLIVGWLTVKTGGLEAGIAAHVVNNGHHLRVRGALRNGRPGLHESRCGWLDLVITLGSWAIFAPLAVWLGRRMQLATATPASRFGG